MSASRKKARNWFRFALKLGLLATDASVWLALNRALSEHKDTRDSLRSRQVADDLNVHRGHSHAGILLMGVGIGAGLGMLLAPVSGKQARNAIRETAEEVRDKWNDVAAWAGLGSLMSRRTGTYAD